MILSDFDNALLARARQIRLLVLDVDGVLTDGKLTFTNTGDEIKSFNSQDGHGLKMLQRSGVQVAIITGRTSHIVAKRANALGIENLIQGREDKLIALEEILKILNADYGKSVDNGKSIDYEQIAYMGDDYPDLPVIRRVGLGSTPKNGHWVLREHSHWVSDHKGGEGAVRQLCDLLMLAQGSFEEHLQTYL